MKFYIRVSPSNLLGHLLGVVNYCMVFDRDRISILKSTGIRGDMSFKEVNI